MQDLGVIHKEVQVHQMVTRRAGLGPLGAGLEEPRVDLVSEQMGEASQPNPHVQLTAGVEEDYLRTMASARTELRAPVSSAPTEISGHQIRGLGALVPMDPGGDQIMEMVETVVSTAEGQAEGQALVASMEMSEMGPFLELERQDVLPTLVLGQPGGLTLDLIEHQEPPEDQVHHQQDDQHCHQLEDLLRLQRDDQELPLRQEGHSRVQLHLQDQPIGQAQEITGDLVQDQQGDQLQRRPENHSQDQRGGQRWDQPEIQTLVETDVDLEELDLMDDQHLVAKEDLALGMSDHKDLEAMVLVPVEDQAQMVLEEVLVDGQLMEALWTLEGLKDLMEEDQALAQATDQVGLDLGEGKMEEMAPDSKSHEEEDSRLALEELVEGQGAELKALLTEVVLEEDLESTVEDLLAVWVVEGDLEVLEMVEGQEALEMEEDQEALEMEEGQEVLEMVEGLEALEPLEMEDDLEDLAMEGVLEVLEVEDDLEALEMEDNLEALEMEEGQVVLAMGEDQEALALEDEVKAEALEYRVALVAGTAWAVVLGSVILTLGEAKKCWALAAE